VAASGGGGVAWAVAPAMDAASSATTKRAFMVSGVWAGCLRAGGGAAVVSTAQHSSA